MVKMILIPGPGEPTRLSHSDLSGFYVGRAASKFYFKGSSSPFSLEAAYDSPVMLRNLAYQSKAEAVLAEGVSFCGRPACKSGEP